MNELSEWSVRELVGQLVMCGFDGVRPNEHILSLVEERRIGGVIYFRRNTASAGQVRELSEALQQTACASGARAPLLVAIDQEGGMVSRLTNGVTPLPGNMALGAIGDDSVVREAAGISGRELRAIGVNVNFAPVLDVNNNPANPVIGVRSYGEDPAVVAKLGAAAVLGYQEAGVSACAKHFPGHGDTESDSHHALPIVPHSLERLREVELVPFREAVRCGVDAVMTAHVLFPALEPEGRPSTLSGRVLTGLLREELGFEGVIVTDCLEMKAISETVGVGRGAVQAVLAGADVVLVSHLLERQREALDALEAAVASGELTRERVEQSVQRILALKAKRTGDWADPLQSQTKPVHAPEAYPEEQLIPSSLDASRRMMERSITLVKNEGAVLPLRLSEPTLVVWPEVRVGTEVDEVMEQELTLGRALSVYMSDVREARIGIDPTEEEVRQTLAMSEGCSQLVIGTYNARFHPAQLKLIKGLLKRDDAASVGVALRDPYDLMQLPDLDAYIACYENRPDTMEAAAKVLIGALPAEGRLPVSLGPL